MYTFVPADEAAHKLPPRDPVNVPDQMINQPHPKTSLFQSDNVVKKKNNLDLTCNICGKTYKNKNSLGVHKRRYHSKLPLRLFHNQDDEVSGESDDDEKSNESDNESHSSNGDKPSRKRKILSDDDTSRKKRIISDSENSDFDDKISKRSKYRQGSRPHISHPPRKRSISPDTHRVLKKIKRRHAEDSIKRKLRKNLEKRRRNKRRRLRRKVVTPKYIEPKNTDDEVDNVSDRDLEDLEPNENVEDDVEKKKIDRNNEKDRSSEEESDEDSSDDNGVDESKYVNCVSVEDFENVRKAIKNYRSDIIINDVNSLHVIQTLFKGILDGWIPICTPQKQMFSKDTIKLIRKVRESKIIDLHSLISKNKSELENIFNFIDKSIKLVVESYNKFGIIDDNGKPK